MKRFFTLSILASCLIAGYCSRVQADNKNLVVQTNSSDCGPAALATLLTYYLHVPATEKEMEKAAGATLAQGTTLLGLEKAAASKGCAADSFRMDYDTLKAQLHTFAAPVIVNLLNQEPHFAVVLDADDNYVFLADPALGNIVLRKKEFLQYWATLIAYDASPEEAGDAKAGQPDLAATRPPVMQGFVFIAAGPQEDAGLAERRYMLNRLHRQLDNLASARLSVVWRPHY